MEGDFKVSSAGAGAREKEEKAPKPTEEHHLLETAPRAPSAAPAHPGPALLGPGKRPWRTLRAFHGNTANTTRSASPRCFLLNREKLAGAGAQFAVKGGVSYQRCIFSMVLSLLEDLSGG